MSIAINLEYKPYVALYRRLSDALRKAILEGRLGLGEPMPSVRDLAESLKLSRATVLKAYEDLQIQGLVVSQSGSGTYVSSHLPGDLGDLLKERLQEESQRSPASFISASELSQTGRLLKEVGCKQQEEHVHLPEIGYGGTPVELSPAREWKSLMLKHCDIHEDDQVPFMIEPAGLPNLRLALSNYSKRRRSIESSPEEVFVFGSKQMRMELIGRLLLNPGDVVAYEEPGYPESRHTLEALAAQVVPVPVDNEGIQVSYIRRFSRPPKLIYVTPSHQDPLTMVMSMPRRQELIEYAAAVGAFILEDDYDSEFRYGKPILPSLKALDHHDCVIYMSSFWKILYQSLRLSYVIFPRCLSQPALLVKGYLERHLPLIDQLALTDLVNDGHLEKHLKRSQRILAHRRQSLILAITRHLREMLEPLGEGGGTHIILNFKSGVSTGAVSKAAGLVGWNLVSTDSYYATESVEGQFIVPFADINIDTIDDTVKKFAQLLREIR
jgi:GntR family transcriptional regulator/MocR family aminotransferase